MKNNNINSESSRGDSGFLDVSVEESLLLTSEQERDALNDLNNRFAKYVEHMKQQELYNSTVKSIEDLSNIPSIQLSNLKQLFEEEINSLRNTLDQQSNDMAKLRVAHDKLASEKSNHLGELKDKSRIVNDLTKSLSKSKAECDTLKAKIALLKQKENGVSDLENQLKECQNQLEVEVLLRTSADNACLTYKEKMEFNEAVFKKELGALLTTHKNAVKKLTTLQNNLSSSNILEQMEEARKRLKDYLNELRYNLDENFMKRIEKATNIVIDSYTKHSNLSKDKGDLANNNHELMAELAKLKASHVKLENQLSDLESLHQDEINRLTRMIREISSSQIEDLDERFRSFQDLNKSLSEKMEIDGEISLYRRMIESEEGRTNHRSSSTMSPEIKKRKLNLADHSQLNHSTSIPLKDNRKIRRPSRHNKSCNIM